MDQIHNPVILKLLPVCSEHLGTLIDRIWWSVRSERNLLCAWLYLDSLRDRIQGQFTSRPTKKATVSNTGTLPHTRSGCLFLVNLQLTLFQSHHGNDAVVGMLYDVNVLGCLCKKSIKSLRYGGTLTNIQVPTYPSSKPLVFVNDRS